MEIVDRATKAMSIGNASAEQSHVYDVGRDYSIAVATAETAYAAWDADRCDDLWRRYCTANARCRQLLPLLQENPFLVHVRIQSIRERMKFHTPPIAEPV